MATDRLQSGPPAAPVRLAEATLADVEAMRALLHGSSVIDWHKLAFSDGAEVDRFLRVNELDPAREPDMDRLEELREDAVDYLSRTFGYRIPEEVAVGLPARELFLLASSKGRKQMYACVVLKTMHVLHHLAGRELLFKLPIADDEVFGFVEAKVVKVVEEIRGAGCPIVEFAWSRKERASVITKLLAKRESIAANVFDKLRFRLITRSVSDLAPVLDELLHRLIPFNYVIPGESVNGVLPFRRLIEETPSLARWADQLQPDPRAESASRAILQNEFSGPSYRIINFVADLPVRIDEYLCRIPQPRDAGAADLGSIIFVLTEFQVMDEGTARRNEEGENSHQAYKERQQQRVKARLSGGAAGAGDLTPTPPALTSSGDEDEDDED